MVLKKSRSRLNSGATLRLTEGRAFIADKLYFYANIFHVSVTPARSLRSDEVDSLSRALGDIWDYLGWQGPHLSKIFLTTKNFRWQQTGKFSLKKSKRHDLPDRVSSMMADVEFLQDLLPDVEIHFRRKQETLNRRYVYRQTVLQSSKIIEKSLNPRDETQKKKSRPSSHFKNRGIQRPYVRHIHEGKKSTEQEFVQRTSLEQPMARLSLELCEAVHVDPRSVKGNNISSRFETRLDWRSKKSSHKVKGCVNGRYGWKKGYSLADMRDDIKMTENDFHDDSDIMGNDRYPRFNYYTNFTHTREETLCLADFIKENKMADKRCCHKPAKEEECYDVGWRQKYPKGSFIVMPKEEVISSSLDMSSWELVDTNELNPSLSLDKDLKEPKSSDLKDSDLSQNVQENNHKEDDAYRTEIFDLDNSFFPVELVMSHEEKHIFTTEKRSEKSMEIEGFHIKVAESFPPSFVLHKSNNPDTDNESYIIGRKVDIKSSSWLISVQGDNCQKLRERMIAALKRGSSDFPCLSDLIHIVLEIERDKICSDFEVCSKCSISQDSDTDALWELLPKRSNAIICSAEKAYSYLQKHHHHMNQQEHHHHMNQRENSHHINQEEHHHDIIESLEEFEVMDHVIQIDVDKRTFECDVCYLQCDISINSLMLASCRHMFCLSCWRRHLYHSIRRGATHLTCMAAQCTTRVDVTTAMTLLPHTRIKQWLTNVRDHYLQVNPFCAWCPADACPRVAVSLTRPLKSPFGFPITCDCTLSWCSNCQKRPHWPASCDQMSAYNKLLDKLSDSQKYRKVTADFYVNLKPCPQCDYPIEKNEGCPHMVCTMCYFNFCWNCLKAPGSHVVSSCRPNGNNFETYTLTNELTHDLPLKYFTKCLDVNKASRCNALRRWVLTLSLPQPGQTKLRQSFLSDCVDSQAVRQLTAMAEECVLFSEQALRLQETFYVLLSFIELQSSRNCRRVSKLISSKLAQLQFITCRLQGHVVGKSVRRIFKSSPAIQRLLKVGHAIIAQLVAVAPSLQKISKHKDIAWVGALDPVKFMRYR